MESSISPEELEAALGMSDLLTSEPSLELDSEDVSWRTQAQRLRGHLSTRLEFALALAAHPGADASSTALEEAQQQLQAQYSDLQAAFLNAAQLTPSTDESHKPEAFRISRLAARWACRLWIWGRCRGRPIDAEFAKRVLAGFGDDEVRGDDEPVLPVTPSVTSLDVVSKIVDAISRFDFLHKDRDLLLRNCVDRIYARARQSAAEFPEHLAQEGYFDAVVRAAADMFVAVYLQEARAFRVWLLSVPEEASAHRIYVAGIVGGLDMTPVYTLFDTAFEQAMNLSTRKADLARSVVGELGVNQRK